jgi:hypothetical protein
MKLSILLVLVSDETFNTFDSCFRWVLEKGPDRLHTGDVEAIFSLTDSDFTRSMWNCQFRVSYRFLFFVLFWKFFLA